MNKKNEIRKFQQSVLVQILNIVCRINHTEFF